MRDRSPQGQLGAGEPPVQARGDILDVLAQRLERLLHRGGVGHQVALALLAEDHPLGAPQTAHSRPPAPGTPAAPPPPRRAAAIATMPWVSVIVAAIGTT